VSQHVFLLAITLTVLGLFAAQSVVFWTIGIKMFVYLHQSRGISTPIANLAVFVTSTCATIAFAELNYRLVDKPSQWLAGSVYSWLLH
jgi:peptidoglycan/LPS O-acetylase OafA/YrhL